MSVILVYIYLQVMIDHFWARLRSPVTCAEPRFSDEKKGACSFDTAPLEEQKPQSWEMLGEGMFQVAECLVH